MTPRSFFLIVLKIMGLYFLKNSLEVIAQIISTAVFIIKEHSFDQQYVLLAFSLLSLMGYLLLTFLLLFKGDNIITLLKLDTGFPEKHFTFKCRQGLLYSMAVVIIGGLLLTIEIPNLIRHLYLYMQSASLEPYLSSKVSLSAMINSSVKIIIGLLFIGERARLARWMLHGHDKTLPEP